MAFTRFHDDPCRVQKRLQESTDAALYFYNVPGQGDNMPFLEDPHVRLQMWGANRSDDAIGLECSLLGLGRKLSRAPAPSTITPRSAPSFPRNASEFTSAPRADAPAWQVRGKLTDWVEVLPRPTILFDPAPQETRIATREALRKTPRILSLLQK